MTGGTQLGPYEMLSRIGAGGMGEVWRARDTRLGREVAIKILPADFAASAKLGARFTREAEAISRLEHPNICRLYDVGESQAGASAQPVRYIVMELLDGESLADRLARGPLPSGEVLRYGQQIAHALDAAHRRGIIHRDLKPANIMITRTGAKLLDFGLAKNTPVIQIRGGAGAAPDVATEHKPLTEEGVIVGTLAYMAPEELEGKPADTRTDIFGLGAVLYEMAAGRRPFPGDSKASVIAAILSSQPEPISRIQPLSPVALDFIVRKCLEKRPDDRWQSAQDVAAQLEWIAELSSGYGMPTPAAPPRARWRRLAIPALIALAFVAGAAAVWSFGRGGGGDAANPGGRVVRSQIALPSGIRLAGWGPPTIAISPDGRHVAFVGHDGKMQRLYLRRLDAAEAVAVPGSESAEGPFFSPDSRYVGFAVGVSGFNVDLPPELRSAPVDGGLPRTITGVSDYFGGTWATDDMIYFVGLSGMGLWKVPAEGGKPVQVAAQPVDIGFPAALPDGSAVIATAATERSPQALVAIDTATGEVHDLGVEGTGPYVARSGHILYAGRDRRLMAARFDTKKRAIAGAPAALVDDVAITGLGIPVFAASGNGTLLYAQGYVTMSNRELTRLVRLRPDGSHASLPFDTDTYSRRGVSVSPDGKRIAATTWDGKLWVCDLNRGTRIALPQNPGTLRVMPLWTTDGKSILFTATGAGFDSMHLFMQAADGSSAARHLSAGFERPFEAWPTSWAAPDTVLYDHFQKDTPRIGMLTIEGERPSPKAFLGSAGTWHLKGRTSPDRRWVAYEVRDGDRQGIFVRRLDMSGGPVPVAADATDARWSPDGRAIYIRQGERLMVVDFADDDGRPDPAAPRLVAEIPGLKTFDVVVGSEDLLLLVEEAGSGVQTSITMVQNWFEELARAP